MAQFEKWFTQDLTKDVPDRHCESVTFTGDNLANVIGVNLFVNGEPYSGGGTVAGTVIRADGVTVPVDGTLDGNSASITLTDHCLAVPGIITVNMKLIDTTERATILHASFTAVMTETGTAVDPEEIIPDLAAIQAAASEAAAAAVDARAAASSAVRYDTAQSLTAAQKAQARANAGAASETALTAMASLTEYGAILTPQNYSRAGVTVVRAGTCSTINGTRDSSGIVRFRMYQAGTTRAGSVPTASQNISGGAQIKAGRTYRLCGRMISGTYTLPETPVYYNDNWRMNAYYAGTTSAWDSRTLIRDGVNYVEECTPEADGEICIWLATIPSSTFTDAVLEIWLEDVTDTLRPGTIATQEEPSSSSATYYAGDLLTVGGTLYKATQAIAAGEVITPGTNVSPTTVAAQLAALEARIAALEG